jgi:hypothetical protein
MAQFFLFIPTYFVIILILLVRQSVYIEFFDWIHSYGAEQTCLQFYVVIVCDVSLMVCVSV